MFVFFVLSLLCLTATAQQFCTVGQTLFDSKCLQFFHVRVDFETAETICTASSGHLVSIRSAAHNQYVAEYAKNYTGGGFWIGAKALEEDVTDSMNWCWRDGSDLTYRNYEPGQPISHGKTSCMRVHSASGQWLTEDCEKLKLSFVCEYPTQQILTKPSRCDSGYTWFDKTDSCYRNYVRRFHFLQAREWCQSQGADLTSIHSQSENDFLVELTKSGIPDRIDEWKDQIWIGLFYDNSQWQWTDGTPITYLNWAVREPDGRDGKWWTVLVSDPHLRFQCVNKWTNVGVESQRAFVCKKAALH